MLAVQDRRSKQDVIKRLSVALQRRFGAGSAVEVFPHKPRQPLFGFGLKVRQFKISLIKAHAGMFKECHWNAMSE